MTYQRNVIVKHQLDRHFSSGTKSEYLDETICGSKYEPGTTCPRMLKYAYNSTLNI